VTALRARMEEFAVPMRQGTHAYVERVSMARTVSSLVQIVTQIPASMVEHVCWWMGVAIAVTARLVQKGSSVNWMQGMSVRAIHVRVEHFARIDWETMVVTVLTHGGERIVTYTTRASVQGGAMLCCPNQISSPPTPSLLLIQTWKSSGQSVLPIDVEKSQATWCVMKNATHMHVILMAMTAPWASTHGATAQHPSTAGKYL
jgi:hypothetical protein